MGRGIKVSINGPGHITKMAAIYCESLQTSSFPAPEVL